MSPSPKRSTARRPAAKPSLAKRVPTPPARQRRRNSNIHEAILAAANELLAKKGYLNVSIEAIAARAGAGKQTIYRWWPSKAHLYMELYNVLAAPIIKPPDTGTIQGDLCEMFDQLCTVFTRTGAGPALTGLISEAQSNPKFAKILFGELVTKRRRMWLEMLERGRDRGELPKEIDLELTLDILSGPVWYRLLLGHAPLDRAFSDRLVHELLFGFCSPKKSRR